MAKPGRKPDPTSKAQIALKKREARKTLGIRERGPKPDPNSATQKRLARKADPRPKDFDPIIAGEICARYAEGKSVREIVLNERSMPSLDTWYAWLTRPDCQLIFSAAREQRAHKLVEEMQKISDAAKTGKSHEALGQARLMCDTRKWIASKFLPRIYGDKIEVQGDMSLTINVQRFSDAPALPKEIDVTP